jgi:hypothetical protein
MHRHFELHQLRQMRDSYPTAAWGTAGGGDAKLFDIFTADISRVLYILCARILSNLRTAWSLSLYMSDRGRIQKNASRGQHILFTRHLCAKGKHLTIGHNFIPLYSCRVSMKIITRKLKYVKDSIRLQNPNLSRLCLQEYWTLLITNTKQVCG